MPLMNRISNFLNNAFRTYEQNPNPYSGSSGSFGPSTSERPHTPRRRYTNERTIISSIYNRISIDFAGVDIRHVKLDDKNRYLEDMTGSLNRCLTFESNLDQAPRAFRQDIAMSLFDSGVIAIVPVDTLIDTTTGDIDILNMRVGKVCQWQPKHVRVSLYNEEKGIREEILIDKRSVAIVENPLYSVMNEPNSTLQRLVHKLNLLDVVDEQSSSGKMDIIIQLPYVIKSEQKRQQAEQRRSDIEFQLKDSRYGIAYTDGSEKITQLNRPAENNLLKQVEYLVNMLYSQLGITEEIMNGTADEKTMLNYHARTIEPLLDATVEAMQRSFLKDKGTDNQERVKYFRNPFKLMPLSNFADIADKLSRNEIASSNELRGFLGMEPSDDPKADQLVNSNMPQPPPQTLSDTTAMDSIMNQVLDGLSSDITDLSKGLSDG